MSRLSVMALSIAVGLLVGSALDTARARASSCENDIIVVNAQGVKDYPDDASNKPYALTVRILDRYFVKTTSSPDMHSVLFKGMSIFERQTGTLFIGALRPALCDSPAQAAQALKEMKQALKDSGGLFSSIPYDVKVLSINKIYGDSACRVDFWGYRVSLDGDTRIQADDYVSCVREGHMIRGSSIDDPFNKRYISLVSVPDRGNCATYEDMLRAKAHLESCPGVKGVELERHELSAMMVAIYLGLAKSAYRED